MEVFVVVCVLALCFFTWKYNRNTKIEEKNRKIKMNDEFKRTLALGIYQRFCKECEEAKYSNIYMKEDPLKFEHFVADIMSHYYGSDVYVTVSSGDFGVDIEHGSGDGKILGQVKCYKNDIGYEPIALIHSNMQKHGASKGYVVTTGGFTENAYRYAEGIDVDLIDGVRLVEMWIETDKPVWEV